MTDSWEDGFDSWTPRRQEGSPDDTGVDLDREALLREQKDRHFRLTVEDSGRGVG